MSFHGKGGHAGTLPMETRRDALVAAAEWIVVVERRARGIPGMRATVGTLGLDPSAASNVVPGSARLSLDLRHARDDIRLQAVADLLDEARAIGQRRSIEVRIEDETHQGAVAADPSLNRLLAESIAAAGLPACSLVSGAGHDAAIMARVAPMTMLFLRSPGGVSHQPDESVVPSDVADALAVMVEFVERLALDPVVGIGPRRSRH